MVLNSRESGGNEELLYVILGRTRNYLKPVIIIKHVCVCVRAQG